MSHLPLHDANNKGGNGAQQSTPHRVDSDPCMLFTLGLTTGGEETFTVVAVLEEEQEEDLGEEGTSVGDLYAFSGP